jgi:hypothetical protein
MRRSAAGGADKKTRVESRPHSAGRPPCQIEKVTSSSSPLSFSLQVSF